MIRNLELKDKEAQKKQFNDNKIKEKLNSEKIRFDKT